MNRYDEQLCKLQAQCARKKKLETCIAELCTQRNTYSARAQELKESFLKEQADVDRLEGRSLSAFFYNVIGKMDDKLTQERQEAYHSRLDEAQACVESLQSQLRRFKTELADVTIAADFQVNIDGFLRVADYLFDGLFADWAVLDQIHQSQDQVQNTRSQICSVLNYLQTLMDQTAAEKTRLQQEIERLVSSVPM